MVLKNSGLRGPYVPKTVSPGAPLAGEGWGLLAQEPPQGKTANASGATTGATEWITRLSVSSAFEDRLHSRSHTPSPPAP
jgi:hypothetical protein